MTSPPPETSRNPADERDDALAALYLALHENADIEPVLKRFPRLRIELQEKAKEFGERKGAASTTGPWAGGGADHWHPVVEGDRVGDLIILRRLGNGGMGVVYKAKHMTLHQFVAVKFQYTPPNPRRLQEFVQRFRLEIEAHAKLKHPNILSIHSTGEHSDIPYFVMELAVGGTLADRLPEFAADPRRCADLMSAIASAVHYAHQRGAIHRDLKPANILFDASGKPMLTDFGTVKLIGQDREVTRTGEPVGTIFYLSPEQVKGQDVSTAADIWGLGVILYEILTGDRPFQGETSYVIQEQILNKVALRPRGLRPKVDRTLDAICMKCLEKEPAHRFRSAEKLATDLTRWLEGKPVQARPVSRITRFVMWCCRKPRQAAGRLAVVAAFLVALWFGYRVHVAEIAQENYREGARLVSEFWLVNILGDADPENQAAVNQLTVPVLMDRAAKDLESRNCFPKHPEVEAEIRGSLGQVYHAMAKYTESEVQSRRYYELSVSLNGRDHVDTLKAQNNLGSTLQQLGRWEEAEELLSDCASRRERLVGATAARTLSTRENLASVLAYRTDGLRDAQKAEQIYRECWDARKATQGAEHSETLQTVVDLATVLISQGHVKESERLLADHIDAMRRVWGPMKPQTVLAVNTLLAVYNEREQWSAFLPLAKQNARDCAAVYGGDNSMTMILRHNYAVGMKNAGQLADAEEELKGVVAFFRSRPAGEDESDRALVCNSMGVILMAREGYLEAEPLLRDAWTLRARLTPADWTTAVSENHLGECLTKLGRYADAETRLDASHQRLVQNHNVPRKYRAQSFERLIRLYELTGKPESAAALRDQLEKMRR